MSTAERSPSLTALELPRELEDLEGLVQADLTAVVRMVATRAHERLFLTKREYRELQERLWNGLAEVVNDACAPLNVDNR